MEQNIIDKLFNENGIITDTDDRNSPLEMDSITFASLMISIEDAFNIVIPTEMLLYEKWKTINLIEDNIIALLENNFPKYCPKMPHQQ